MKSTLVTVATDAAPARRMRVYHLDATHGLCSPKRGEWLVVVYVALAGLYAQSVPQVAGGLPDMGECTWDGPMRVWTGRMVRTQRAGAALFSGSVPRTEDGQTVLDFDALPVLKKRAARARKPGSLESGQRLLA